MIPVITDYTGMIKQICRKKSEQFGIEQEELEGRAGLIFVEALGKFDPSKGCKFITFFHLLLNRELVEWQRGFGKEYSPETSTEKVERFAGGFAPPHKIVEFKDSLKHLSDDSKSVLKLVLSCPEEIVDGAIGRSKLMRGNIKGIFKKKGWTEYRIWQCFSEIQDVLSN